MTLPVVTTSPPATSPESRTAMCRSCPAFKGFDGRGEVACLSQRRFVSLTAGECPVWANGGGPPPAVRLDSPQRSRSDTVSLLTPDERRTALQPVCMNCPSSEFRGFTEAGHFVNCERRKGVCCGGTGAPQFLRQSFDLDDCPAGHWKRAVEMYAAFDAVVVLTLRRRTERLAEFWNGVNAADWPFRRPEVFFGLDGAAVPTPDGWTSGPGAWGCLQSHRMILEKLLTAGARSALILEDDAVFCPDFRRRAGEFMANVPEDWDGMMLGGQHMEPADPVTLGVLRCVNTQRTHAFALRRNLMESLYKLWAKADTHCDHVFASVVRDYKVYAPHSFLVGQRSGFSDITYNQQELRYWQGGR